MKADEGEVPSMVPARMLNEFDYCPRLCYIEWVQQEFRHSFDTKEGDFQHRRVSEGRGSLPEPGDFEEFEASSVHLSSEKVGVTTKMDLIEGEGEEVIPVDYKKGRAPDVEGGAYLPERVQLCAQGLVLRDNGYTCKKGVLYFVKSKKRVEIEFDEELVSQTESFLEELQETFSKDTVPPPLEDSPKCPRCSLVGVCLPDETNLLKSRGGRVRKLLPARDDEVPVYVTGYGHTVSKKGKRLEIRKEGEVIQDIPIREVSQLSIYGNSHITLPALRELLQLGAPVCYFSHGGWFYGYSMGNTHKNVALRIQQYKTAFNNDTSLRLARAFIKGKIQNCRTLIRRNDPDVPKQDLNHLDKLAKRSEIAADTETLLGIEGAAAQTYFSWFNSILKTDEPFSFEKRNKRPPLDPVNAVLSYLYGMLSKECFIALLTVGFDPYLGFFHVPKYGRPALALDLMEEFRPLIAGSVTFTLFNNRELQKNDFVTDGSGVNLRPEAKKTVVQGYERRMNTEITHPLFGYRVSYRRILEVQARLLSRTITEEIDEYPPFCTR